MKRTFYLIDSDAGPEWHLVIKPGQVDVAIHNQCEVNNTIAQRIVSKTLTTEEDNIAASYILDANAERMKCVMKQILAGNTVCVKESGGWFPMRNDTMVLEECEQEEWPEPYPVPDGDPSMP